MASADSMEDAGAGITLSSVVKEIQGLKDKFKREDSDSPSPFADLEKATVLQECRMFADSKVVTDSPRKCSQLITKLLHIVTQGDSMSSSEVTEVFFGVTKLFQSNDASLRRMIYFFIKEVAETCNPDDVIIVTSSLTKDMNSNEDLFRANSIRVLAKMIDTTMLGAIERYLKQAIVDKNPMVSSSALVAGFHLIGTNSDVVRRWVNEVQEALNCASEMVQFHALSLLYEIKRHDRLAISKMVAQLTRGSVASPLATCLLIRYITMIMRRGGEETLASSTGRAAYQFLELSLRHRSETVIYEAAKALCSLPGVEDRDLGPAVAVLQLFLSSPKSTLRLAAMRALSTVAMSKPSSVTKCNDDMESLIADNNRSIATYAITTLLKTGSESSVDRLMKQISSFMNEIADEFKIVVVVAIRELCLKYPLKHRVLVGFLANFLREEGGFEFKKSIVDAIVELIRAIPETKESSLFHLCEFIEDCEFTALSTQILYLVGSLGPTTIAPARYIRFIYNRVILENAVIRACAVTALTKFAASLPALRSSVCVLLRRSLRDEDDEVRDRATLALRYLGCGQQIDKPIDDDKGQSHGDTQIDGADGSQVPEIHLLLKPPSTTFPRLSRALKQFEASDFVNDADIAFNYKSLPDVNEEATSVRSNQVLIHSDSGAVREASTGLSTIPDLAKLGSVFASSQPTQLTESEAEYLVVSTKHVMNECVVLEFAVTNTISDQVLTSVGVSLEPAETLSAYEAVTSVSIPELRCGVTKRAWLVLRCLSPYVLGTAASFVAELNFRVLQVEPDTGDIEDDHEGFAEEYPLEDIEINTADFMKEVFVSHFRQEWESLDKDSEVLRKFGLPHRDLSSATNAVVSCLGMQPLDKTGATEHEPEKEGHHYLHFSGVFAGNFTVLARAQVQIDSHSGCILKLAVRSSSPEISKLVAESIK